MLFEVLRLSSHANCLTFYSLNRGDTVIHMMPGHAESATAPGQNILNTKAVFALLAGVWLAAFQCFSQTLNLPPRPPGAPNGTQFTNIIISMSLTERENWIYAQVMNGNVPNFQRTLLPINVSAPGHTGTYYASPDYLAIGTDADYFLEPTTPLLAQRLCNALGYTLPTRKMANQIWTNSTVKMNPQPIPPDPNMITVPYFAQENFMVRTQRNSFTNAHPLGALVSGDKKDVIVSTKIYTNFSNTNITMPVVIYGWFYTSGDPIQPLYNGHEETYADYSHGIRLVQNSMTVDGNANTVTNVLTQSALAVLLSDEGSSEGTTSDHVIRNPRYTPEPVALAIITHPRSQTVLPGAGATFGTYAVGDGTLGYRWQRNGANISGGTNLSLTLSNIQTANAGSYTVIITNSSGSITSRPAVLRVNTNVHPLLYADNFETNSSANWNLFQGSADGVPDYTVDWAFDYGVIPYTFNGVTSLIPAAPNSPDGSTHGVRFTVNNNDADAAVAGVNIYPKLQSFSGNYALKFDMWINYPGGAGGINSTGSTEYAICGLNHLGTQVNWAAPSAASSDGIWFAADGEGGSTTTDYRGYLGNLSGTEIDITPTSGLIASNNSAAIFQALFPSSRFETAGAPGKNWVQVELRQTNNFVVWILDDTVIAQRTNASSFTAGDVMIGFMDPFSSIANPTNNAFVLFDNVRVENLSGAPLLPPSISAQPTNTSAIVGTNITLSVGSGGSNPLSYQWRFNGTNVPGATSSSLQLANVQYTNAGSYDVLISNAAGLAASAAGVLTVLPPPLQFQSTTILPNGQAQLTFSGGLGESYTIQSSSNLVDWITVSAVLITNNPQVFVDATATNSDTRFYRAR